MSDNKEIADRLEQRLNRLVQTQVDFQKEILQIRAELARLRGEEKPPAPAVQPQPPPVHPRPTFVQPEDPTQPPTKTWTELPPQWSASAPPPGEQRPPQPEQPPLKDGPPRADAAPANAPPFQSTADRPPVRETEAPNFGYTSARPYEPARKAKERSDLEKFIGENLISKIAIVLMIIGVGIGAKYAIDNGWITPVMRVVFGYAIGTVLVGLAIRLRPKYLNFSAVLLGGGMAIMYFITYFAYSIYDLMPQWLAFVLMVAFTAFTVAAALVYSRQAIAHFGLVGAYAVPFLLSNNSGNFAFLFSYVAIINIGILAISIRKYWKPLVYTSFIFTWATFLGWFATKYNPDIHLNPALLFLGIFFSIFYLTTIIQHRLFAERTKIDDLILTLVNASVFYGSCLSLLDSGKDNFPLVLAYVAAFMAGILIVSIRDYRRPLLYVSFMGSWLIYSFWYVTKYRADEHFSLAVTFLCIFFAIFYAAGLTYSRLFKEKAIIENIAPILTNSFVFFGLGYALLYNRPEFATYMGLYTVAHAAFHFVFAAATSVSKKFPAEITYLLTALVITFITIAIPVQFDGRVVTLIWAVEAAALFRFGRARQIPLFEYFAYLLSALATLSLMVDWQTAAMRRTLYEVAAYEYPLYNGNFVTALVYVASFAFIYYLNRDERYEAPIPDGARRTFGVAIAAVGLGALYNTFRIEIGNYFHYQSVKTIVYVEDGRYSEKLRFLDEDLDRFNFLWQLNYTMLFLTLLSFVNTSKVRSALLGYANLVLNVFTTTIFVTIGLYMLMELRESYLGQFDAERFTRGSFHIAIGYICYMFTAGLFFATWRYTKQKFLEEKTSARMLELAFDTVFYISLWIIISSELVSLMDMGGYADSYKLGLSILWGAYALFLVATGIYFKMKKHLRVGAITLFAITLVKVVVFDISRLSTIAKTAVFISLAISMLIVSFLYNKYKTLIFGEDKAETD